MGRGEVRRTQKLVVLGHFNKQVTSRLWEASSLHRGPQPGHWGHLGGPLTFLSFKELIFLFITVNGDHRGSFENTETTIALYSPRTRSNSLTGELVRESQAPTETN